MIVVWRDREGRKVFEIRPEGKDLLVTIFQLEKVDHGLLSRLLDILSL